MYLIVSFHLRDYLSQSRHSTNQINWFTTCTDRMYLLSLVWLGGVIVVFVTDSDLIDFTFRSILSLEMFYERGSENGKAAQSL